MSKLELSRGRQNFEAPNFLNYVNSCRGLKGPNAKGMLMGEGKYAYQ